MSDVILEGEHADKVMAGVLATYGEIKDAAVTAMQRTSELQHRPSAIYRPTLSKDGNAWVALYGPDIATGVVGCGMTPAEAMDEFDLAWSVNTHPEKASPAEPPKVAQEPPQIRITIAGKPGTGKSTIARMIRTAFRATYGIDLVVHDDSPHALQHMDARIAKLKKKNVQIDIYANDGNSIAQQQAACDMYNALHKAIIGALWDSSEDMVRAEKSLADAKIAFNYPS